VSPDEPRSVSGAPFELRRDRGPPVVAVAGDVRGNVPKELADIGISEYREQRHKPWRMIYRILATDVVVYCVVDGRRDIVGVSGAKAAALMLGRGF